MKPDALLLCSVVTNKHRNRVRLHMTQQKQCNATVRFKDVTGEVVSIFISIGCAPKWLIRLALIGKVKQFLWSAILNKNNLEVYFDVASCVRPQFCVFQKYVLVRGNTAESHKALAGGEFPSPKFSNLASENAASKLITQHK